MTEHIGASRRDVLKGGALGMGALGAFGVASAATAGSAAAAVAPPSNSSVDLFLKLDGIAGESIDAKHKDEIQLLSFSWGASNPVTVATGGGAHGGRARATEFAFVARTSKASPLLFLNCATGKHIRSGLLTVRKAGELSVEYIKITLTDILVSSYKEASDDAGGPPADWASLNFGRLQFAYYPTNVDGALGQPVTTSWDFRLNRS